MSYLDLTSLGDSDPASDPVQRRRVTALRCLAGKVPGVLGLLMGIVACSSAFADQWGFNVTPTQIRSSGTYTVVTFSTAQALTNPLGCNQPFYVVSTQHQSQSALAILLAAYAAGTNVSIYVLSSSCDSTGGDPG